MFFWPMQKPPVLPGEVSDFPWGPHNCLPWPEAKKRGGFSLVSDRAASDLEDFELLGRIFLFGSFSKRQVGGVKRFNIFSMTQIEVFYFFFFSLISDWSRMKLMGISLIYIYIYIYIPFKIDSSILDALNFIRCNMKHMNIRDICMSFIRKMKISCEVFIPSFFLIFRPQKAEKAVSASRRFPPFKINSDHPSQGGTQRWIYWHASPWDDSDDFFRLRQVMAWLMGCNILPGLFMIFCQDY